MIEDRIARIEVKMDSIIDLIDMLNQRLDIHDAAFKVVDQLNADLQAEMSTIRINQKVA